MSPVLRILLVSVDVFPSRSAEALQVDKILRSLQSEAGVIVDVATGTKSDGFHSSELGGQLISLPCSLLRWQRVLLKIFLPSLSQRPDWWFLFAWRWRAIVHNLYHPPQLIYSRSFPLSSTIAAYHLANYFRVPWFLHISDPWCETSLNSEIGFINGWHRRWERKCFMLAKRISFTSPVTLLRYQERYPQLKQKMTLDPNTYEAESINKSAWIPGQKFRLVHTGSFTNGRWPDALFCALLELPPSHALLQDLEFVHAGPFDYHTRSLFNRAGPWFQSLGQVTPAEAFILQKSADLLLVIDYSFGCSRDAQFLPSKLIDYLAIRRPILAITDEQSASWQFVKENSLGLAISHGNTLGIVEGLLSYWQAWRNFRSDFFELCPPSTFYEASHVSKGIVSAARTEILF